MVQIFFYICGSILLFSGEMFTVEANSGRLHHNPDAHGHSSKFHDSEFITNEEHMKTHHQHDFGEEDDTLIISPEEHQFRFFYSHDYNNDTSLDGLEMWQAISHGMSEEIWTEWENAVDTKYAGLDRFGILTQLVDEVLEEDDLDNNGYISYEEFSVRRRREANADSNRAKS